jgi:hypothetical protein
LTVVLQHRFWDLVVTEDYFEVKLTFDSIPERLEVPFDAIKVFFDPSVPYGLQFEDADATDREGTVAVDPANSRSSPRAADVGKGADAGGKGEKKPRPPRRPAAEKPAPRLPAPASASKSAHQPAPTKAKASEPPSSQPPGQTKVVSIDAFRKK